MEKRFTSGQIIRIVIFAICLLLLISSNLINIFYRMQSKDFVKSITIPNLTSISKVESNNSYYLGTADGKIYSIDSKGDSTYEFGVDDGVIDIKCYGDYIYIATDSRKIFVCDLKGNILNTTQINQKPLKIAGNNSGTYIGILSQSGSEKSYLDIIDIKSESKKTIKLEHKSTDIFLNNSQNEFIITSGNELSFYNLKGIKTNLFDTDNDIVDGVYIQNNNTVFAIDSEGNIYSINCKNYKENWIVNNNSTITAVDYVSKEKLTIVATNEGYIYIYDENGGLKGKTFFSNEISNLRINSDIGTMVYKTKTATYDFCNTNILKKMVLSNRIISISNVTNILFVFITIILLLLIIKKTREILKKIISVINKYKWSYIAITPTIIGLTIFCYFPAVSGMLLAFMEYKPGIYTRFNGINNFIDMIKDEYFWVGFGNMLVFLITGILKALLPPVIFAEIILAIKSKKSQYISRVLMFIPGILPGVAGLLIWTNGIYGPTGLLNQLLSYIGMTNLQNIGLGNQSTVIWMLVMIGFPFVGSYLIFYGAIMNIPGEYFEACKIEGCSWFKRIIKIDIPLILPQIKYIFILTFIGAVQEFNLVYLTTQGGPGNASYTPMLEMYFNVTKFQNYGLASAMGMFMFVLLFGATIINLRIKTQNN